MPTLIGAFARLFDPTVLLPLVLQWAVKATLLCGIAAVLVLLARGAAPAVRHGIWTAGVVGLLLMPFAQPLVPPWELPPVTAVLPTPRHHPVSLSNEPVLHIQAARTAARAVNDADGQRVVAPVNDVNPAAASVVLGIWVAGAAAVLVWFAVGYGGLDRLSRRATEVSDPAWEEILGRAAHALALRRRVRLCTSPELSAPCVAGLARPSILLPGDSANWPAEKLRVVLLHELAHIRRYDRLTQLLAQVASALLWFSPLSWYVAWRIRVEREHACDDAVLATGTSPVAYAEYLLEAARAFRFGRTQASTVVAMARYTNLEARLLAILGHAEERRTGSRTRRRALIPLTVCLALPIAAMRSRDTRPEELSAASLSAPFRVGPASASPAIMPVAPPRAIRTGHGSPRQDSKDSVYARVVPEDGATELVLTGREIRYLFTARGMRAIDSSLSSSRPDTGGDHWLQDLSRQSAAAGMANMRITFPLRAVQSVVLGDRTLTLLMDRSRVRADGREDRGVFRVEAVRPVEAEAFARAFGMLKVHR